jgi:hypothetical protein
MSGRFGRKQFMQIESTEPSLSARWANLSAGKIAVCKLCATAKGNEGDGFNDVVDLNRRIANDHAGRVGAQRHARSNSGDRRNRRESAVGVQEERRARDLIAIVDHIADSTARAHLTEVFHHAILVEECVAAGTTRDIAVVVNSNRGIGRN